MQPDHKLSAENPIGTQGIEDVPDRGDQQQWWWQRRQFRILLRDVSNAVVSWSREFRRPYPRQGPHQFLLMQSHQTGLMKRSIVVVAAGSTHSRRRVPSLLRARSRPAIHCGMVEGEKFGIRLGTAAGKRKRRLELSLLEDVQAAAYAPRI